MLHVDATEAIHYDNTSGVSRVGLKGGFQKSQI